MENQTSNALPPFNISTDILNKADKDLGKSALPNNYLPIPVHVYGIAYDNF